MKGSRNKPPQSCSVSEYPPGRLHDPSRTRARTHTHTHTHTQTCSQIHTRALRYTCTLPQTHAGINTCKQTGAHLYAHMHAETHAHSHTCTLANNVHTGTRAHAPAFTERFSPGRAKGERNLPSTGSMHPASSARRVEELPNEGTSCFLTPQLRQLSNSPFSLPRFNLLPRNSLSAKS